MRPIIVDASVYIAHLRAARDVRALLVPHLRAAALYNCGVIRAEVVRGMKSSSKRDGMVAFFDIIPEIPCDAKVWRTVSELGWNLGRKGKWPPVTDLVIAACAMRVGAMLVTLDKHFEDIDGLPLLDAIP